MISRIVSEDIRVRSVCVCVLFLCDAFFERSRVAAQRNTQYISVIDDNESDHDGDSENRPQARQIEGKKPIRFPTHKHYTQTTYLI